jgi:hypothetical protein
MMGQRRPDHLTGQRSLRSQRSGLRAAPLPVVLVQDELVPVDPHREMESAARAPVQQSPFLTTALVGILLAGASYFVGFL